MIFHDGTNTCIPNTLSGGVSCFSTSCATSFIGGTMSGTTIYGSTAVCSAVGKFSTCIDAGSGNFSSTINAATGITIGTSGTNDISWNTSGGIKLGRTNVGPEYALSQRWTGTLAYIDIGASCQWNGGVTILPNGGGCVGIGTNIPKGVFDVRVASDRGITVTGTVSSETVISGMQGDVSANLRNLRIAGNNLLFNTGDGTNTSGSQAIAITSTGIVCIGSTASTTYGTLNIVQ